MTSKELDFLQTVKSTCEKDLQYLDTTLEGRQIIMEAYATGNAPLLGKVVKIMLDTCVLAKIEKQQIENIIKELERIIAEVQDGEV